MMVPFRRVSSFVVLVALVCWIPPTFCLNNLQDATESAASWLLTARRHGVHWGKSANALALLSLSNTPGWNASSLEAQVAIKQMDIDFLFDRLSHGDIEIYSNRLVPLITALVSLCRNPTNYYDYDLLDGLMDLQSPSNFSFASEVLAVCGGEGAFRRSHTRRLHRLLTNPRLDIDTMAMTVMASGCVANHYGHRQPVLSYVDEAVQQLITKQRPNGSFNDNVVSTALVVQALQTPGLSLDTQAAMDAAIHWLKSIQSEDGSFHSDLMETAEALLALSPKGGRAKIHLERCQSSSDHSAYPSKDHQKDHITFKVLIWIGQPAVQQQSHLLRVPANETLIRALESARSQGLFQFEAKEFSFGHYITSVNNIKEVEHSAGDQPAQHWALYVLPEGLTIHHQPPTRELLMKTSITTHRPREGERILLWYRPFQH